MLFDPFKLIAALTDPTLLPQLKTDIADAKAVIADVTKLVEDIVALFAKIEGLKLT